MAHHWDKGSIFIFLFLSVCHSLSEFASKSHQAGSAGDIALANKVLGRFKEYGMDTWTDGHFVKLVDPPASGSNMVTFKGSDLGELRGYLAYSKTGTAKVIIEKNPVFLFIL